ncbi:hypothetical protein B296_00024024 [Ensete ventricosum]|uniref:Retrotransposon gag domain-containing protein n=1 Tax=Ensete ventricosum TaxID=4639 RepID=A0A426Z5S4_ENSVE|nr:hypothetical protein B296_00024024 [Ensete ventricosum]
MSQDHISNLIPSQMTEEAAPLTPALVAMPQIAAAPSAPQSGITDGGQSALTPDRYWRLFTDPGLTPPVHASQVVTTEAFLGLTHQVQALTEMIQAIVPYIPQLTQATTPHRSEPQRGPTNQEGSREPPAPTQPGPIEPSPPETRSETPSIVLEKSTAPHLRIEHPSQDQHTLPSDSTNSFKLQLRRVNEHLDEVQKEVTKSKEEAVESSKHKSPFAPEIRDKPVMTIFRLPVLESYDGSSNPTEHVAAFRVQMALHDSELEQNFLANSRPKPTAASLLNIAQGREEPLAQFVHKFTTESRAIPDAHPSLVI